MICSVTPHTHIAFLACTLEIEQASEQTEEQCHDCLHARFHGSPWGWCFELREAVFAAYLFDLPCGGELYEARPTLDFICNRRGESGLRVCMGKQARPYTHSLYHYSLRCLTCGYDNGPWRPE